MKNTILLLVISLLFIISGCVKQQPIIPNENITPDANKGNLYFHIHSRLDKDDIKTLDSAYFIASGDTVWVKSAKTYISNIRLLKSDGSETKVAAFPTLISQDLQVYNIGKVIAGNYRAVTFDIGFNYEEEKLQGFIINPNMMIGEDACLVKFEGAWYQSLKNRKSSFQFNLNAKSPLHNFKSTLKSISILPQKNAYVHLNIDYFQLLSELNSELYDSLNVSRKSDNPLLYNELTNKVKAMVISED